MDMISCFRSKIVVVDSCWIWNGPTNLKDHLGCGVLWFNNKKYVAHRLSWILSGKELKNNEMLSHSCNNLLCVNPEHLFISDRTTQCTRSDEDFINNFWSKVDKKSDDECWNWLGCLNSSGYGNINRKRKILGSHRVSYILKYGEIPNNLQVLHTCDNPACVNPNHLFLGTNMDNMQDKIQKGRQPRGEKSVVSVLTDDIVRQGKELRKSGMFYSDIAKQLGVDKRTIWFAITGHTWKHVI